MSTHPIGFIGAGQLARMAGEAASALGLSMAVLAEHPGDAACGVAAEVVLGSPFVAEDLRAFAARCDVLTFDHEQVDLDLVAGLASEGTVFRPGAATLELAVDKARMRTVLDEAGVPVPAYLVVDEGPGAIDAVERFAAGHGWPVMVKAARGGYDGKAVWPVADRSEAASVLAGVAGQIVVEELLPLQAELAVVVARRPSGASAAWPAVETAQVGGVCREVLVPGRIDADVLDAASALGQKVAEIAGGVGVMAVELFWSGGRLLVNEVATRPHNSGHWTMEGAVTSQFENHVRAVLDLPLGSTAPQHPQVASVNVFGGPDGADPADLLARGLVVEGAHVHLYGKVARPGRKLGHVTVCGDDAEVVRSQAWSAAIALGTPVPDAITLPAGLAR
ncbi:MAG TPA: 5-(carboxyamino)imidazole ribonucleotide synthase [Acidimicrobiales bacterium]